MQGQVRAPEIDLPGLQWFNVDAPLPLQALRGKLVILDFWTFCCINCMHILPALRRVEDIFADSVVVIGVHSPKFPAERDPANLAQAIARYGIHHPVVHDPDFRIWQAYAVRAWPTLMFIGSDGSILGASSGEPDPDKLLQAIAELVATGKAKGDIVPSELRLTPETAHGGRLAFPGKMKPLHRRSAAGDTTRHWAVADAGHQQIVLLDQQGEELRRIGSGRANLVDGGFDDCCFRTPQGLVCDNDRIYVADTGNHAVRLIDLASEQVTTLAGLGRRGPALPDAAPGRQSALASPWDLELDGDRLYIANAGTHQLALLTLGNGMLHRLAGDGGEAIDDGPAANARLAQPSGLALSPDRRVLYFADSETSAVRALALDGIGGNGAVETLVGRGLFEFGHANGDFAAASLQHPLGLCWYDGGLLVADSYNNALRRLDLSQRTVSDFDGGRFLCHDPICLPLGEPAGVTADGDQVFVVDTNNHRILRYLPAENRYDTWFA